MKKEKGMVSPFLLIPIFLILIGTSMILSIKQSNALIQKANEAREKQEELILQEQEEAKKMEELLDYYTNN